MEFKKKHFFSKNVDFLQNKKKYSQENMEEISLQNLRTFVEHVYVVKGLSIERCFEFNVINI